MGGDQIKGKQGETTLKEEHFFFPLRYLLRRSYLVKVEGNNEIEYVRELISGGLGLLDEIIGK